MSSSAWKAWTGIVGIPQFSETVVFALFNPSLAESSNPVGWQPTHSALRVNTVYLVKEIIWTLGHFLHCVGLVVYSSRWGPHSPLVRPPRAAESPFDRPPTNSYIYIIRSPFPAISRGPWVPCPRFLYSSKGDMDGGVGAWKSEAWTMTLMCLLTFWWNSMTLGFRRAVELKPGPPSHRDLGHFWKSDLFGSSVIWFSWTAKMEQRCRAETDTTHYLSSCLRHEHKVLVIVGNEQVIEDLNWHHRSHICHYQGLSGKGAPLLFFSSQ